MEGKVTGDIHRHGLLAPGERVVVAVSGGADSVTLLHLLCRLRDQMKLDLYAAHLNHGLRKEAEHEAEFVRHLAQLWGVPLTVENGDVLSQRRPGDSLEDVARRVRRAFLERVADRLDAGKIALGHQANDQAETLLMHLIRGSGLSGLAGMAWRQGRLIRPLLGVTREQIREYCLKHSISWVEDPSNSSLNHLRNRIRSVLLPLLAAEYNPRILQVLGQTASILAEEELCLEEEINRLWPVLARREDNAVCLRAEHLRKIQVPLARRAVRKAFFELVGRENNFLTFGHVQEILGLLARAEGKTLHLPRGVIARREGDMLSLRLGGTITKNDVLWPVCRFLPVPGQAELGQWRISSRVYRANEDRPACRNLLETEFDFDLLEKPLFLRYRQPGDYFYLSSAGGRKKLQDFFVDIKLPRSQRDRIPLVTCPAGLVWVVGYRSDHRWRINASTKRILRLAAKQKTL